MTVSIEKPELSSAAASFVARKHKLLIDGKWVEAQSGRTFAVEDPATLETITDVPNGSKADIDMAVAAARRALESGSWPTMSPADRSKLVWRIGDLIEKH